MTVSDNNAVLQRKDLKNNERGEQMNLVNFTEKVLPMTMPI